VTQNANEAGSLAGLFTVSINAALSSDVNVAYRVLASSTAVQGTDYVALSGTVTFLAGSVSETVSVIPLADSVVEFNESVVVELTGTSNSVLTVDGSNDTATLSILDDDTATLVISAESQPANLASRAELDSNNIHQFKVTLTGEVQNAFTIPHSLSPGSALSGSDYVNSSGNLSFPAGANNVSRTFNVTVIGDSVPEPDETFFGVISNPGNLPSGLTLQTASSPATLLDDDLLTLSVIASLPNAAEPGIDGEFTFSLSETFASAVTVNYTVDLVSSTATPNVDYTQLSGSIVIPANTLSATLPLEVLDDGALEVSETVILNLASTSQPLNIITLSDSQNQATVNIADNDTTSVSVSAVRNALESNLRTGRFRLRLGETIPSAVNINYTVSGSATSSVDYSALSGVVTIPANTLNVLINVTPETDNVVEFDESIQITLTGSSASSVTLGTISATIVIEDDDTASLSISSAPATPSTRAEGNSNNPHEFRITLTGNAVQDSFSVPVTLLAGTAALSADYSGGTPNPVVFAAGTNAGQFEALNVTIIGDSVPELNETFSAVISSASSFPDGLTISSDTEIVTIDNDDGAVDVSLVVSDAVAAENGSNAGQYQVVLSEAVSSNLLVSYSVSGTATGVDDYLNLTGSVTVLAGQSSANIDLVPVDDSDLEGNETVILTLQQQNLLR